MLINTIETNVVRELLNNLELKIILDSPINDYRFEYFTNQIKNSDSGMYQLIRTYQLTDLIRGGITSEPWDTFDFEKQISLVTNLVNFGNYRIVKVISGWIVNCPTCNHIMQGKIWQKPPKKCQTKNPHRCPSPLSNSDITEILHNQPYDDDRKIIS